jgi:hypothetical protein
VIDVDVRPWVSADLEAILTRDSVGAPVFLPLPQSAGQWFAVLLRILGKLDRVIVHIHLERERKRSDAANRWLWASYRIAFEQFQARAREAGQPCPFDGVDDLHEWWKCKHLGFEERVGPTGKRIEKLRSTTKLNPGQFGDFVDAFAAECHEHGVFIPPPTHGERSEWK